MVPYTLNRPFIAQEPYLQSQCDCCSYRLDPDSPVRILNLLCPDGHTEPVVLPMIHSCQCSACQGRSGLGGEDNIAGGQGSTGPAEARSEFSLRSMHSARSRSSLSFASPLSSFPLLNILRISFPITHKLGSNLSLPLRSVPIMPSFKWAEIYTSFQGGLWKGMHVPGGLSYIFDVC